MESIFLLSISLFWLSKPIFGFLMKNATLLVLIRKPTDPKTNWSQFIIIPPTLHIRTVFIWFLALIRIAPFLRTPLYFFFVLQCICFFYLLFVNAHFVFFTLFLHFLSICIFIFLFNPFEPKQQQKIDRKSSALFVLNFWVDLWYHFFLLYVRFASRHLCRYLPYYAHWLFVYLIFFIVVLRCVPRTKNWTHEIGIFLFVFLTLYISLFDVVIRFIVIGNVSFGSNRIVPFSFTLSMFYLKRKKTQF